MTVAAIPRGRPSMEGKVAVPGTIDECFAMNLSPASAFLYLNSCYSGFIEVRANGSAMKED